MERKAILDRIAEILADLNEQQQCFVDNPEQIGAIEMELFRANIKFLADHAAILERLYATQQEQVSEPDLSAIPSSAEMDQPDADETNLADLSALAPSDESLPLQSALQEEPLAQPNSLAADPKPSINDLMGDRATSNLAAKLSHEPLKDLKSAISLNDKLLFIKDLFSGYSLAYQEAIDLLNKFQNFEEADRYLKANYIEQYKWSEKQDTADRFYELLNRRFLK